MSGERLHPAPGVATSGISLAGSMGVSSRRCSATRFASASQPSAQSARSGGLSDITRTKSRAGRGGGPNRSSISDARSSTARSSEAVANLRYSEGITYGDVVVIRCWLEESRSRQLTFAYELLSSNTGKKLVSGYTRHIWTDTVGKVTRAPEIWNKLLTHKPLSRP